MGTASVEGAAGSGPFPSATLAENPQNRYALGSGGDHVALELAMVYAGVMIAVPSPQWEVFGQMSARELAGYLREWGSKIDMKKLE